MLEEVEEHSGAFAETKVHGVKKQSTLRVSSKTEFDITDSKNVTIYLEEVENKTIIDEEIKIKIGDNELVERTNKQGYLTIDLEKYLKYGDNKIFCSFAGNNDYSGCENDFNIKIVNNYITLNISKSEFKKTDEKKEVKVFFNNTKSESKISFKDKEIIFILPNEILKGKTDKDNKVIFDVNGKVDVGETQVNVKFNGDSIIPALEATGIIKVTE